MPFELGGTMASGINVNAPRRLRRFMGFPGEPEVLDRVTQMAEPGDDVRERRGFVAERMSPGMWEHAMWLRGYEQFYRDMALQPEMVQAIMSKELELKMA